PERRAVGRAAANSAISIARIAAASAIGGVCIDCCTRIFPSAPCQSGKKGTGSFLRRPQRSQSVTAAHGTRPSNQIGATKVIRESVSDKAGLESNRKAIGPVHVQRFARLPRLIAGQLHALEPFE